MKITDVELIAWLEAVDEALWDMQFANSQDVLKKLGLNCPWISGVIDKEERGYVQNWLD